MIKIKLVDIVETEKIINFFENNLDRKNKAIYSEEFFCPFGISAAIKRKQIFAIFEDGEVLAAVRIYKRKRDGIISVYQFAVGKKYRGKNFLKRILKFTKYKKFEFSCPKNIDFNDYYLKIGAKKSGEYKNLNLYILEL